MLPCHQGFRLRPSRDIAWRVRQSRPCLSKLVSWSHGDDVVQVCNLHVILVKEPTGILGYRYLPCSEEIHTYGLWTQCDGILTVVIVVIAE